MTTKLYNKKILISQYRASDISRGHEIPQNSQKNAQNNVKFTRNHIKYLSVQHLWNLSWLLGLFTRHTLANLSWNFIQETSKQRFSAKFTRKYPRNQMIFLWICPWKSCEIWLFSLCNLSEALSNRCLCICENGVLGITYMQMSTITRGPHKKPVRFAWFWSIR